MPVAAHASTEPLLVVMELMDENLEEYIRHNNDLPVITKAHLAIDIATGLYLLHSRLLVHRDIKPSNVLLTTRGGRLQAKLAGLVFLLLHLCSDPG